MTESVEDLQRSNKSLRAQLAYAQKERDYYRGQVSRMEHTLEAIATPKRADGTYNRCREACELLAKETLEAVRQAFKKEVCQK
jgi:hypothetical protein